MSFDGSLQNNIGIYIARRLYNVKTWRFARYIEYEFSWLEKKSRVGLYCHIEPKKGCGKQRNGKFYAEWSLT